MTEVKQCVLVTKIVKITKITLHAVTSSVIYYSTHTQKKVIYLFYTITRLLWAFSLVVDRDLLNDTCTDGIKSTSDHVS